MTRPPTVPCGYRSEAFSAALGALGRPVPLGQTGGFLLERGIPGTDLSDLMGPYPLFCCGDWGALAAALRGLGDGHVTVTLVTDPFCPLPPADLAKLFPVCRPLHDHYVIDLADPPAPSRHHRRKLRQAEDLRIEAGPAGAALAADWVRLYEVLVARKGIRDMRRFDAESLRQQLGVPGAHLVTAWDGEDLVGADLYYLDGEVAYAHLSAYSEKGYAGSASYPMMAHAILYFRDLARYIDLGGAPASTAAPAGSGLVHFKSGWTTLTRPSHLCGKVLDEASYETLCSTHGGGSAYFPTYRQGEFKS